MAVLYGGAFVVLHLIFKSRLERRLGISVSLERRVVQLAVAMFILAVVSLVYCVPHPLGSLPAQLIATWPLKPWAYVGGGK